MLQICIRPMEAYLTRDTEFIGNMDPYCKIYLGGQLNRTQVKEEGGKNPRWRDSFYYTLQPNSDPTLKVEVWDDDPGSDQIVGSGSYNLAPQLMQRMNTTIQVDVFYQGTKCGAVTIGIDFNPNQMGMGGGMGMGMGMGVNMGGQMGGQMGGNMGGGWGGNNAWGNNPNNNQYGGGGNWNSGW